MKAPERIMITTMMLYPDGTASGSWHSLEGSAEIEYIRADLCDTPGCPYKKPIEHATGIDK